jgi:hypothetical protein
MVVDTSAVLTILRAEPGNDWLSRQLYESDLAVLTPPQT